MKLINKTVLAKLLTVFLLMGVLSFYAAPQVDAKSDDIDIETIIQKAKQGNAFAQYKLGVLYGKGEGVPQDYKQAAYWLKKSAEQGHAFAQYNLGVLHGNGEGVPQDYKQAVYWYTKSAKQGNAFAQYNLGSLYYDGQGVPQNYKLAYVWTSLAAAQGLKSAIKNRNIVAKMLSSQQLVQAQELASKIQYKIDNPSKPQKSDPLNTRNRNKSG